MQGLSARGLSLPLPHVAKYVIMHLIMDAGLRLFEVRK